MTQFCSKEDIEALRVEVGKLYHLLGYLANDLPPHAHEYILEKFAVIMAGKRLILHPVLQRQLDRAHEHQTAATAAP